MVRNGGAGNKLKSTIFLENSRCDINFHQLETPKIQECFFDFVVLDHLMCCKNSWDFGSFWSEEICGWDPAKSVPGRLEFSPLTKHSWHQMVVSFRFLDVFTYQQVDKHQIQLYKTCASNRFFFFCSRWGWICDKTHLLKRRLEQHLIDVESWDSLLFWITWCVDLIAGLGQNKTVPEGLWQIHNSCICAVLILRDVPSMFVSDDYLSQGGNLCTHWDI